MKEYTEEIRTYLEKEIEIIHKLDMEQLSQAINVLVAARDRGARIYIMGNGGSAATASHFVCDFNKGIWEGQKEKKFKIQCLSDNVPIMTAIANDIGYEDVFLFQLQENLEKNDLVVAISGSGNSKNVLKAVEYAKTLGCETLGITGYNGGKLKAISDYSMHVPVDDMQITEDIHMIFDHMIMHIL